MVISFILFLTALLFTGCSSSIDDMANADTSVGHLGGWKIEGVSQKGPFVTGSTVSVLELDGESMLQTGRIFKSTIKSDRGDFVLEGDALISQYAMIEVNGYYRNEVTGLKSTSPLALNAIVDLSDRKKANVNLLTHLEYERVKHLASEGMSVKDAKAQAQREILETMAMSESKEAFEDLNIFEAGEENAKLLAISILLQGEEDVADFTERIGKFAIELAEKGVWEDSVTRATIADRACEIAQRNMYSSIREKILKWGLSGSLPDFEKYIDMFWVDNYGLGKCSDSNKGDTTQNTNTLSKRAGEKFVCDGSSWIAISKSLYKGVFGTLTDKRDGKTYKTVQIGEQVWMAENLNYDYRTTLTYSICYKIDENDCNASGRLYPFAAAVDSAGLFGNGGLGCSYMQDSCNVKESSRGVCPEGWHLPSKGEWEQLISSVDGETKAEIALRTADDGIGTDNYGFNIKDDAGFWTSTYTLYSDTLIDRTYGNRPYCLYILYGIVTQQECGEHAVRCVMD